MDFKNLTIYINKTLSNVTLSEPPGIAGQITREVSKFEHRSIKEIRPLVALSILSILNHHKKCYGGGKLHFQGLGIALSGAGKEAHITFIKLVLEKLGMSNRIASKPRSDKNILQDIIEIEDLLYIFDEAHSFFNQATKSGGCAFESGMLDVLLEAITSEKFYIPSKIKNELINKYNSVVDSYSKKEKLSTKQQALFDKSIRITDKLEKGVNSPFLSLVGYSTPINLDTVINEHNIEQGLLGRFIILKASKYRNGYKPREINEPSDELLTKLKAILNSKECITIDKHAKTTLNTISKYFELDEHLNHPQLGAIYARGTKWVMLISSLLASERNIIMHQDICYAAKLFLYNIESCEKVLNHESELEEELFKKAKEITLKYTEKNPIGRGVLASKLTNCCAQIKHYKKKNKDICNILIDQLIEKNLVYQQGSNIFHITN